MNHLTQRPFANGGSGLAAPPSLDGLSDEKGGVGIGICAM